MLTILRDAGLSRLIESDAVERLAGGFLFTEGPLWLPDGSLLFQDIKAERTYRLGPDRSVHLLRDQTGAANGQTFGAGGSIVFCEQTGRRISRLSLFDGTVETVAESWAGARLNSPNDLVCRSDASIYFTDPAYGVEPSRRSLHFQGVFSLNLGAWQDEPVALRLLADDFEKAERPGIFTGRTNSLPFTTPGVITSGLLMSKATGLCASDPAAYSQRLAIPEPASVESGWDEDRAAGRWPSTSLSSRGRSLGVRAGWRPAGHNLAARPPVQPGLVYGPRRR